MGVPSGIRLYIYIQGVSCIRDQIVYLYTEYIVYQGLYYIIIYRVSRASMIRLYIYIQGVSCIRDQILYLYTGCLVHKGLYYIFINRVSRVSGIYTIYLYTPTVSPSVHVYVYPCYLINQINQSNIVVAYIMQRRLYPNLSILKKYISRSKNTSNPCTVLYNKSSRREVHFQKIPGMYQGYFHTTETTRYFTGNLTTGYYSLIILSMYFT